MNLRWPHLGDDHFLHNARFRELAPAGSADALVELDLRPELENGGGALQGGMLATLVDITAGLAVGQHAPPQTYYATQDLAVHYLAGVRQGPARAEAHIRKAGRRTVVVQVDVLDAGDDDRLCAIATVTYMIDLNDPPTKTPRSGSPQT